MLGLVVLRRYVVFAEICGQRYNKSTMGKTQSKPEERDTSPHVSGDMSLNTDYSSHYAFMSIHQGTLGVACMLLGGLMLAFLLWRRHLKLRAAKETISVLKRKSRNQRALPAPEPETIEIA